MFRCFQLTSLSNDCNQLLNVIAKLSIDALRLDLQKPTEASHEVALVPDVHSKDHQLKSQNFRNRVRRNKHVHIAVTNETGDYRVHGTVGSTFKQLTQLQVERGLEGVTVTKVITTGRTDSTHAEAQRAAFVLRLLQGSQELGPWVQNVWLPADDGLISWPEEWLESVTPPLTPSPSEIDQSQLQTLNASQQEAVNTMLSTNSDHHITIIQGPPGTGKTSVIASYVQFSISSGRTGIWLVAQSNVAVKNIAEKLIKVGFFNWRLLVSQEYYDGWHEHQYDKVQKHKNLIGSSSFKHAKKQLQGVPVILCTLDMLANPHILSVFTPVVPINSLVVDEASQIEIGNYLIPFSTFQGTLRKVCFIGDDKQLPPFGQEEFEDIQSIFEVEHLNKKVIFLDTQYRMPPQIGRFISAAVYDSKLESNPLHPVKDTKIACKFINVVGKERNHQDSYQAQFISFLHLLNTDHVS
ncbi:hypothetical protein AMATHDRAFT_138703 [Amanita thiersii Skay4041]|uniref:DNA2/NAM7 helicase-like C-terminal domain-containing protein n=1 Tax=Amanita thiersii Skay4041 TaxID=703135 RepID=A0A2A9NX07_9AGAR|nr:hypothetical protein AMATHDRAFT_138703 [Amanita thiersii Skay4041]